MPKDTSAVSAAATDEDLAELQKVRKSQRFFVALQRRAKKTLRVLESFREVVNSLIIQRLKEIDMLVFLESSSNRGSFRKKRVRELYELSDGAS